MSLPDLHWKPKTLAGQFASLREWGNKQQQPPNLNQTGPPRLSLVRDTETEDPPLLGGIGAIELQLPDGAVQVPVPPLQQHCDVEGAPTYRLPGEVPQERADLGELALLGRIRRLVWLYLAFVGLRRHNQHTLGRPSNCLKKLLPIYTSAQLAFMIPRIVLPTSFGLPLKWYQGAGCLNQLFSGWPISWIRRPVGGFC